LRVLVTGGAGFIGSHLVDALIDNNYSVTILDNFSTGKEENIERHLSSSGVHFIRGDVRKPEDVRTAIDNVDIIVHLAALIDTETSMGNPLDVNEVNIGGTLNLLHEAASRKIRRFIFASSTAVYGHTGEVPIREDSPARPISPYAVTKLAGEEYCDMYARTFGLDTLSLRLFNIYGPRQASNHYAGVITIFLERAVQGLAPKIYGNGEQTRDFIHVRDVVRAFVSAMQKNNAVSPINVGTGISTRIIDLAEMTIELSGRNGMRPQFESPRVGDIEHSFANTERASNVLGFSHRVNLRDGLQELIGNELKGPSIVRT